MTEKEQLQQKIQSANLRADEQVRIQQLHQQVSDIMLTSHNGQLLLCYCSHPISCRRGRSNPTGWWGGRRWK